MWLRIQNLITGSDASPFFDTNDLAGTATLHGVRRLITEAGRPYSSAHLESHLLTGSVPCNVVDKYSEELKDLVRDCLARDQAERVLVDELKVVIDKAIARPPGNDDGEVKVKISDRASEFEPRRGYI
jgi:hypothetical protein